jgi:heat-inducible transcriptional repressor
VSRFFDRLHGDLEETLDRASGLLAELTSYAAVVVGPRSDALEVRSVQLVGLGPRVALLVLVLADGAVEKRSIEFSEEVSDDVLARASARLGVLVQGRALGEVVLAAPSGSGEVDAVVGACVDALHAIATGAGAEQVYVGGPSQLAHAFDAVETVRSVLAILEQELVVVGLLRAVLDRGLSVAIGAEHGYEPLLSCAVVVAPLSVDGRPAGAVGLLGPTRMNYPRALAAAHVVGERLGERIEGTMGVLDSPDGARRHRPEQPGGPAEKGD